MEKKLDFIWMKQNFIWQVYKKIIDIQVTYRMF